MTLLRLALATAVVLAPGAAIARALGVRAVSAAIGWSLTVVFAALAVTFVLGSSLALALALLLAAGFAALPLARRAAPTQALPGRWWVLGAGVVLGLLLWHVAGEIGGDGLFHLARVRKLDAFGSLSLESVDEFRDGGLHPGYAFPLWHGFLALVAEVAFLDPADVVLHEASVLAPLAVLVTYEVGYALFRRIGPALAVVCAQVGVTALAPGHGGAYTALGLPATASRQLLAPAALALALGAVARPSRALVASAAAAGLALAVVHPTYAIFLWLPFGGFAVVRALTARGEVRPLAAALAALVLPAAGFLVWLLPLVRDTRSVGPGTAELRRAFDQYSGQLDVFSESSYRLSPEVFGRGGAIAVAALLLVPLAGFALRRRWAAYVLGGSLAVAAVMLVPLLFVTFSDVVSLSQSRRAAGFLPFAFAFAGGLLVLAERLRPALLPLALAAGVALQLVYPGDFGYRLSDGGPALATWLAVVGGAAALVLGLVAQKHKLLPRRAAARRRAAAGERAENACVTGTQTHSHDRVGALAAVAAGLFVLPVAVHAAANWSPSAARPASPLTGGLVAALRREVPRGDVVYSDLEASYRIVAFAPVYVAAAPPGHVADTDENRPYERREENRRFFRTGDLGIPRAAGARWLVIDRTRFALTPQLPELYRDERYSLYRLGEP